MHSLVLLTIGATAIFLVFGNAVPVDHVVHEKRESESVTWRKQNRVEAHAALPVRIGLTQSNLENGYDYLYDVSDPDSPNYGKHWTPEQVIEKFAPSKTTVEAVYAWLESSGVDSHRIIHHENKGWLVFDARAEELERLIHADFHEYEHEAEGLVSVGCDYYHLPAQIQPHVDYITPGVKLSAPLRKRRIGQSAMSRLPQNFELIKDELTSDPSDISNCDKMMTPACIRALYQVPLPRYERAHPNNSFAVWESGSSFNNEDLNRFFAKYAPYIPNGTHPISLSIDGGIKAPAANGHASDEGMLDIQVAYPIISPLEMIWYQVDDPYWANKSDRLGRGMFNTFLDALDGSYCNYTAFGETGDDPIDPHYPDKNHKNGYRGKTVCGVYKPAKVVSISAGREEDYLPEYYSKRQCNEWMKLSLQGTTFVRASGDEGVGGSVINLKKKKTLCGGKDHKRFDISGQDGCPALLTVGGTMVAKGNTVRDPEVAMSYPKTLFWSTGGFSNVFTRPKYQDNAINAYFKNHKPPYRSYAHVGLKGLDRVRWRYNRIGRGIPDVSATGMNFVGFVDGHPYKTGGTSGSAPLFAGLLARINDERLRRGKSTVGFVNPVLYKHPEIFQDITNGTNPGCGTEGFTAVKGWDPVTGLGTPNYPRMLELFLSLP